MISIPFQRTLDVLAATPNPLAVDVLSSALHLPDDRIRLGCLLALLKRRSTRGNVEVIRGLARFTPEIRSFIDRNNSLMSQAVKQCLLNGDDELRTNALDVVHWFEDYSQIPTLLNLLDDPEFHQREKVGPILRDLVGRLHEHVHFGRDAGGGTAVTSPAATGSGPAAPIFLRDAPRIRHQLLSSFESACHRFDSHRCLAVVEGVLALGDADSPSVRKVLSEFSDDCRQAAEELLCSSDQPGVMSLVVHFLALNIPPAVAFAAFERRLDLGFISQLLKTWPRKLSAGQQKNFRKIEHVPWLEPDRFDLDAIPPALHKPLVAFVLATGVPDAQKLHVLEWVVRHGSPEARVAATGVLVELRDDTVQDVIIEGLDSAEPDVQAWAMHQLRARDVPHAFALLVERLDSPLPEVQDAARAELGDFDLEHVLEIFEQLEAKVCAAVGRLVQKVDPRAIEKLKQELSHGLHRRKVRAARAALALGLQNQVTEPLLALIHDADAHVRRTAFEVLGHMPTRAVVEALAGNLNDPNPRVREAASRSLHQIRERQAREMHEPSRA